MQRSIEQRVAVEHEETVLELIAHERQCATRSQWFTLDEGLYRQRRLKSSHPARERLRLMTDGEHDVVHSLTCKVVEQPLEKRPSPHGKQWLRLILGQFAQASPESPNKYDRLTNRFRHSAVPVIAL